MIINPKEITDYNRSDWDIQKFFLFCTAVAGKKSEPIAVKINNLSDYISAEMAENPYYDTHIRESGIIHYLLGIDDVPEFGLNRMKEYKLGKYNQWEAFFKWWIDRIWNIPPNLHVLLISDWLRRANVEQLEKIPGVGKKTSRFFKLHTDPEATGIPLDTHILKFIKSHFNSKESMKEYMGEDVPSTTPQSSYAYTSIEKKARVMMEDFMKRNYLTTLAEADLAIWKSYAYK